MKGHIARSRLQLACALLLLLPALLATPLPAAAAPSASVYALPGPHGMRYIFTGTGLPANRSVFFRILPCSGPPILITAGDAATDATGRATVTFDGRGLPPGCYRVEFNGGTLEETAFVDFTAAQQPAAPTLVATPAAGPAGSPIDFTVHGLPPFTPLTFRLDATDGRTGIFTYAILADKHGNYILTFDPGNLPPGQYRLSLFAGPDQSEHALLTTFVTLTGSPPTTTGAPRVQPDVPYPVLNPSFNGTQARQLLFSSFPPNSTVQYGFYGDTLSPQLLAPPISIPIDANGSATVPIDLGSLGTGGVLVKPMSGNLPDTWFTILPPDTFSAWPGGSVYGRLYAGSVDPANGLDGATVELSGNVALRQMTITDAGGYYVTREEPGADRVCAYPPANTAYNVTCVKLPGSVTPIGPVDFALTSPFAAPAGILLDGASIAGQSPRLSKNQGHDLAIQGCPGGSIDVTLTRDGSDPLAAMTTESIPGSGTFAAHLGPFAVVSSGTWTVKVSYLGCTPDRPPTYFTIYIDPSGVVQTTAGLPLAGAAVTLYRADSAGGPFTAVPDGSGLLGPANRRNPDATRLDGSFGWDAVAGFYKVRTSKAGCAAPGNPAQSYVESAVLPIPPPVLDLDLRLDCGAANGSYTLALTAGSGGTATASPAGGSYPAGSTVMLTATPDVGQIFVGWDITLGERGPTLTWANPLALPLTANAVVAARFAPRTPFGDVPGGDPAAEAIAQLAARGVIFGCDRDAMPPLFCPTAITNREQMAALLIRAMPNWAGETWPQGFSDPTSDAELMRRVATLQTHNVAQGYAAATCAEQGKAAPCFGPLDDVRQGQVILFIARAMVYHGYWQLQADDRTLFPDQNGTGDPADRATQDHRMVVTYVHYVGAPPDVDATPGKPFATWATPAPRGWFARAFWPALNGYFGAYRAP